ncbi:hypothetical protein C0991_010453 [Blastosporella zonata]|nr:hypothetical protein C0991_010453 [Blastosporella zonata]
MLHKLKAGLACLKAQVETCRNEILTCIQNKQSTSQADDDWLDSKGNLVSEERVVELLDEALDYERSLARLDLQQKIIVEKLKELGDRIKKAVRNKRKWPETCKIVPQSEKQKAEPVFNGKKKNATLKQRIEILDWHHAQGSGFKQKDTAAHWNKIYRSLLLKQPLILDWLKNEAKICQMYNKELDMGSYGGHQATKADRVSRSQRDA